jgi:signal transduction histidine kinase
MDAASETLATVAHELRTPVAALMMTVSMLVSDFDELDRDQTSRLLERMQRSMIWLQGLIENLTSTAALDAGGVRLRRDVVSVDDCVEQVWPIVQPLFDRQSQSLRVSPEAKTIFLCVDPQRFGQVLTNLLVNASRYSSPGDVIELDISSLDRWTELRVVDHGPGVPAAERDRIFERHVRGSQAGGVGLGLGLSIVRGLVELHGGTVTVDDTPHGGASFRIRLPHVQRYAADQPAMPPAWTSLGHPNLLQPATA